MQNINIVIAAIALMVLSACSGTTTGMELDKQALVVNPTTVSTWNLFAAENNFGPADENKTLGDLYYGSDFASDMDNFEVSIANQLGLNRDDVQGESTMGFVHFDDEWVD